MATTLKIRTTIKTQRKKGPDGDFEDLAARVVSRQPIIAYRTAQAISTTAKLTAPQPPRKAWWYDRPPNPKTKKTVPVYDQYVRTGTLAASVTKPLKVGDGQYTLAVGAPYAKFVENGTRYMPPQPFWRAAVAHARHDVLPGLVDSWLKKHTPTSSGTGPELPTGKLL